MVGTTLMPIFVVVYDGLREVLTMIAALPMQQRANRVIVLGNHDLSEHRP
jgi:hypothetical protein